MPGRPQGRAHRVGDRPSVPGVREPRNADDVVAGRLRTVLAVPESASGTATDPPGAAPTTDRMSPGVWRVSTGPPRAPAVPGPLAELSDVGEPLHWSDIITAWPDDVDLDTDTLPPPPGGFPPGSPWATAP